MSTKIYRFLFLLSVMMMTAGAGADSKSDNAKARLSGYEWQLPASIPTEEQVYFEQIAADAAEPSFIRSRAIQVLTLFPTGRTEAFFKAAIHNSKDSLLRRRLVDNYCLAFVERKPEAVAEQLTPLLYADDPHLRVACARCLDRMNHSAVRVVLKEWVATRENDWEVVKSGLSGTVK